MTAPMKISRVGAAALDTLAALHAASLEEPWSRRELALFLAQPGAFALIATAASAFEDHPLGLALCRVTAEESELIALGVVPSGRRRGAGRALVERSIERVAAMGGARITLKVAEDNDPALRLSGRMVLPDRISPTRLGSPPTASRSLFGTKFVKPCPMRTVGEAITGASSVSSHASAILS